MRILAVSDHVADTLYRANARSIVGPIDLLLACGDLPYSYLEYLVTTLQTQESFFVHGNHDAVEYTSGGTDLTTPGGLFNLDRQVVRSGKLLIAGLEGSIRYKPRAPYQYSESEMKRRMWSLIPRFLLNRVRYGRYVDIVIAHSPPAGIHDGPDGPHRGFECFLTLMRRFRPRLLLHGHKHHYGPETWHTQYESTEVVNVYPFRIIELDGEHISYGRVYRC